MNAGRGGHEFTVVEAEGGAAPILHQSQAETMKSARPELTHGLLAGGRASREATNTIRDALIANHGVVAETARELQVDLRTLQRWLKRYPALQAVRIRAAKQAAMQLVRPDHDTDAIEKQAESLGHDVSYDSNAVVQSPHGDRGVAEGR